MTATKVDMFLMANAKNFPEEKMPIIRDALSKMDENKMMMAQSASYHNPTTMLIISILAGGLGIDRFMIGDTGLGVGKLLTCGGFGIWTIVDLFMISNAAREKNFEKFMRLAI